MTGRERIAAFQRCGIDPSLFPLFLRALQHITAIHGSGSIDDNYRIHRHLSAHQWSPFSSNTPLLGYPHTNSEPFRDCCPDDVDLTKKNDSTIAFRADIPYNGLLNQGATCYLNSLLQALFHISAFRSIIYEMPTRESADDRSDDDRSTSKSIPYALQRLFCMLQTSSKAVGTTELTESFGWSASDSFIQHDVHELTRVLLDNLQKKLSAQSDATDGSATNRENAIHRLFHGCLESYIKVEEANYYGSREEPFYDLQLVVKNTKNIYTSLDTFFQVEVLDGKNRYCLEQNGKKSYHRAEKGVRLKQTPPIMLLHLTRFDYDVQRGESKVFTRWDYYNTLDLSRYMPDTPVEKTHYTLCSVLVHSGSTTGFGHYFCFLLCSGAWYKFNDEVVSPASLKEVFGDNFGGFKINFWGSEVPHTNNAYMLVYVRTSEMDTLLRPISASDVPRHVMDQIHREQIEQDRQVKERAVDYLYGRVHFVLPPDVVEQPEVLSTRRPVTLKVSTHRTLRVLLESEALPEFLNFVEEQLGIAQDNQLLWFASLRRDSDRLRLYAQVRPGMKVRHILDGDKECCILVTTKDASIMTDDEPSGDSMYQIFHHKLYDPLHLRVHVLGSTVVLRSPDGEVSQSLELMKPFVRQKSSLLPDESSRCRGHHLKGGGAVPHADDLFENSERELSTVELSVVREDEYHSFLPCDKLSCGDILVWQYNTPPEDKESVFYANIEAFQHFLRRKIPVVIKLNSAPTYPVLLDTELADDMTYEQLQRYVARLVGDLPNFDRIRFTRHNPDTELPYFMKGKKRDRPTLAKLLTPATTRVTTLSRILYYEYCKYTVTEIESAHSLQFKLYSDCVKRLGSHWVLMPREVPITARDLFSTCLREIIHDLDSGDVNSPSDYPLTPLVSEGGVEAAQDPFISFLQQLRFEDAWKELRLVDVWRGRIYNVFDRDRPLVFEHHTFEESAEYRVERIPQPVCGVPLTEQFLLQVYHFTMVRQRKDPVETHSEPFSFYIAKNELPAALLRRIADKLEVSLAAVQDWKLCLVREKNVVEVQPDIPMGVQIQNFCSYEQYQLQKEPLKSAFLGLEHAPTSKRTKREERVVIFN